MSINLDDPLPLATAARYSFPQDATAVLPVVFGDYLSSTHVPEDDEDGGFLPAVCIDKTNWVYLLNDVPNVSGPIRIYANDTRQEDHVYAYSPMFDYEGRGHLIAAIQFNTDPASRAISWRGQGARAFPADTLLTNPIDALGAVFSRYGGWSTNDTHWASVMETKRLMTVLGDTINMVFAGQRTYREWLETVLQLYHCDMGIDDAGRLRFMLDTSVTSQETTALTVLDARRDLAGAEAEPLTIIRDPSDLVTKITVKARRKWTTGDYTVEPFTTYPPGVSRHGERHRRFEMPGLYSYDQYRRWLQGMWIRYGMRADRVVFTVRGLGLMSALPGTFLGMISPKRGWTVPQLLKVLNCEPDEEAQTVTFECFDTQRAVGVAATLPVVVMPSVRARPIRSSPTVDLVPPSAASDLIPEGSYRRIVLRWTAPGDLDYHHTEIWASAINQRVTATHVRNGGVGVPPGQRCEETFEVADGASYYVWLMSVDTSGNGANGGTGFSGGHWYPSNPTGGILATAALVPTSGIEPDAITERYHNAFGSFGVFTGLTVLAGQTAPSSPQSGWFGFEARATIQVPSMCTLVLEIHESTVSGPLWGFLSVPNILLGPVTYPFLCQGQTITPNWGGVYGVVAYVLDQGGTQVAFTVHAFPSFTIIAHKK